MYRTTSANTWPLARNASMMWPWGHAAIGYLLYTRYMRRQYDRPPEEVPTVLLLLGTQFPDLIDKPLAWTLALLPSGRSLGHSLLVLVPLSIFVYTLAVRYRHSEWGSAFAIGALSHVVVDVLPSAIRGEYAYTTSLLWPLLSAPPYSELNHTILGHFSSIEPRPILVFEIILTIMMLIIWWRDGRPGVNPIRCLLTKIIQS